MLFLTGEDNKFAVQFNVVMEMEAMKVLEAEIKSSLGSISHGGNITTTMDHGAPQSATLRFPSTSTESQQELVSKLQKATINGKKLKISPPGNVTSPLLCSF